jgi:DNA-binding IclR family transcriptional regulator
MESSSLTKALGLLEATAGHPEGRTLGDLAAELGMPKPTAHRILKALTALGYLERPQAGVYRQSTQVKRLVSDAAARRLIDAASRQVRLLHSRTKERVNLGMLRHDRIRYLEVLESSLPLRCIATHGSSPFHTTALGRAIAAYLPAEKRRSLLSRARMERRTSATIVDRRRLLEMLEQVAKQGYAIEIDETDVGVMCIAAPVFAGDVVAGAISISLPTARAAAGNRATLVKLAQQAAAATSARLSKAARLSDR